MRERRGVNLKSECCDSMQSESGVRRKSRVAVAGGVAAAAAVGEAGAVAGSSQL